MIVLGRITAPYGVRGWVKVHPFGDDPLAWRAMASWWLAAAAEAEDSAWQPRRLVDCRRQGASIVAQFEGVSDRTGAEALKGMYVGAPREVLPATGSDEYYWADLVGLRVVNLAGEPLGVVRELISSGAHDVLCVRGEHEGSPVERLLPFTAQVVKEVNVRERRLVADWGADW